MQNTKRHPHIDDLKSVSIFRECTPRELRMIDGWATRVEVPAGRVLCVEGEIGSEFCLIVRGSASVERNGRPVARLGPGESFGELALLGRNALNRRMATVVAAEQTRLVVFSRAEFNTMLDQAPSVTRRMLEKVSNLVVTLAAENARFGDRNGQPAAFEVSDPHDVVVLAGQ
jgi:CRP-like cAMP-binding protein